MTHDVVLLFHVQLAARWFLRWFLNSLENAQESIV